MREVLSDILTDLAAKDPRFIVLTGDHGYALFDALRKLHPDQYLNVGVAEQAMIGIAAGMAQSGFRPIVYGLASFVPVRVVEQIKIDLCTSSLPCIILGDGAGLVYSKLGFTHQCGEDLACLRALPHIKLFTPADAHELTICFAEAYAHKGPSYIRIGKADRPPLKETCVDTDAYFTCKRSVQTLLIAHGAMSSVAESLALELNLSSLSMPRIKPFPENFGHLVAGFEHLIILEEHSLSGGLNSAVAEYLCFNDIKRPKVTPIALMDKFTEFAGDHQFALSEHDMSDHQVKERVKNALEHQATQRLKKSG